MCLKGGRSGQRGKIVADITRTLAEGAGTEAKEIHVER